MGTGNLHDTVEQSWAPYHLLYIISTESALPTRARGSVGWVQADPRSTH